MATLDAAVGAIPPASNLVKHLHLTSRLPRRDGDVTVCTHCSLDRLDRLEAQAFSWSGVISAAVMCPCPCGADSLRVAKQSVRAIHGCVESSGAPCRLDIILVAHPTRRCCQDPWRYPINALRNIALRSASTELVVLLDVDFLPGFGIQEQLWKVDVYSGYLRACTDLRRVVILPALEEAPGSETISAQLAFGDKDHLQSALEIVAGGKADVEKLWTRGRLRTFAAQKYPRGHGPTDTGRWINSDATYEVEYEVDYEPYFLCARRLVPWFDERFTGYGKNKIIHVFHTAVLDFRFWVHPEWYLVHVHHDGSMAWDAVLGSEPLAGSRLSDIRRLYAIAKHELLSLPIHSGVHLPPTPCACAVLKTPLAPSNRFSSWKMGHGERREEEQEQMGHWASEDQPSPLLLQTGSKKYLQALYDLRYHFCVQRIRPVVGDWPLRSKLPRNPRDISLVTVATADRFQRLSAQCCRWKGVICAAIYAPPDTNVKDLVKQLLALHLEVEKAGTCRLDLILMGSLQAAVKSKYCKRFGGKSKSPNDLCPINELRNAALGLATTDLVLILDVDLLPAPSLNDCFLDERQYECLSRMAMEERTAVVVPSFEYSVASRDTWTENANVEGCPPSQPATKSSSGVEIGKEKEIEKVSTLQEVRCISETQEMTERGVEAICDDLDSGGVRGFHVKHYPAGHNPTNFKKWRDMISGSPNVVEKPCCEVCRSYSISFAEGFEPFIICSRKLIPSFDERFRGYGFDKITFFYHLHLSGFQFRVLLHSFAFDIPHPKSKDWTKTFGPRSDPLQHIRVKALYQRAKREIRVVTGGSALANHVVDELPLHFSGTAKPSVGLRSKSRNQLRTPSSVLEEKENRLSLDGLQLAWQGVIQRLYNRHRKNSSEFLDEEISASSLHRRGEEDELSSSMGSEITELPQKRHVTKQISRLFEWNSFWANSVAFAASESKTFDSINSPEPLEEFEWDSTGWKLKCSPDSLSNCSVVKAPQQDPTVGEKEWFQTGDYWLRVFMSAGSWSPQASRLAGITTGGVSVRSVLPMRAVKDVVVRYMVRFPSSFEWVKGGTLPGLWVNDVLQASFGWRRAGEGHLSTALIGLSKTETDERTSFTAKTSNVSRPFYFVPEQWHALQIAISVVDQTGHNRDRPDADSTNDQMASMRSSPRQNSVEDGVMVELRAFVDFELVSTITYPCLGNPTNSSRNGRDGRSIGLLLSCYFGGKTQDWASQEDTHIDFSRFEIWTD